MGNSRQRPGDGLRKYGNQFRYRSCVHPQSATGDDHFYGEWLVNAQGEDVVAGTRTPSPINEATKSEQNKNLSSLETAMPKLYKQLDAIQNRLEKHYTICSI